MKKIFIITAVMAVFLCLSFTVYADDVIKISMNNEVKQAKAVSNGEGITFTLPDVDSKFLIDTIELAIFEKQGTDTTYKLFGESKLLQNPTSLNISFGFGDISKFKEKAKYKIAYRYYVKPIDDFSKVIIAGSEVKDGWRLVGEINPQASTEQGFAFYKNSAPTLDLKGIIYQAETVSGINTFSYDLSQLENVYLPADVFQSGVTVNYTANDFDSEDNLTVKYKLIDGITNELIASGDLNEPNIVYSNTNAEYIKVVISAVDNWGMSSEEKSITLKIDKEHPVVVNEFSDMGRCVKGKNLYSKFTITDDQNDALSSGNVYYSIKRENSLLYENVRLPDNSQGFYTVDLTNMADGEYEIILTIFDKAYNKSVHTLKQTLDNTAPAARFLTPSENNNATLYGAWMNESKKILISATDSIAGVKKCSGYRNYSYFASTTIGEATNSYIFSYDVSKTLTGKLSHFFYIYDNACTLDKQSNTVNLLSNGNSRYINCYVWLDKTLPSVTINADESGWYPVPTTIYAGIYDYPSSSNVTDNSGVKTKQYSIMESEACDNNWLDYQNGVTFSQGGVYYLHVKAIDFAGNEIIITKKIKLNTVSQVKSQVTPTDDSKHTIYNEANDLYIIKNTAYNTKYHFTLKDDDVGDTIKTEIRLVSQDNSQDFSKTAVETAANGLSVRDIVFNMTYTKSDGTALPDGIYTMYLNISEIKNDGAALKTNENVKGCEVLIKRNSPPTPVISVSNGYVTIDYPSETLANSLDRDDIKALYKKEFKAVTDKNPTSNIYKTYTSPFATDDIVVTALYTDPAGNVSMATKRIYKETADDDGTGSIIADGNTVTIEESRPANTYYIGTRRDKQVGINNDVLKFLK